MRFTEAQGSSVSHSWAAGLSEGEESVGCRIQVQVAELILGGLEFSFFRVNVALRRGGIVVLQKQESAVHSMVVAGIGVGGILLRSERC
jgi:hypothetical protein